ncbi:MAG: HDIG domain-containing protein [Coriobacteriia bacterium]|nr:HDIG domain-containing protein [Coriobacteriia bacterium]
MLSRDEATALLVEYGEGLPWTRHCVAVADAAEAVGALLEDHHAIDVDSLWSAGLLHDIGRYATHDPIMHGVEGYNLLMDLGHPEAAFVCASHVAFGLRAGEAAQFGLPARDFIPRTPTERIVPLVDLLFEGDRPTTLEIRFASLRQRNAGNDSFLGMLDRGYGEAKSFLTHLDLEIGHSIVDVVASCTRCS